VTSTQHDVMSFCRYTVFRVVNLPDAGEGLTACITLFKGSACPTLGSFCHNYDAFGGCQFSIQNKAASCCPTSITAGQV
jgi:hypothetical protein